METLKRGRERLAEKRKQEREAKKTKKQEPINIEKKHDDYITKLNETYKKINDDLNSIESRINIPTETKVPLDHSSIGSRNNDIVVTSCPVPPKRPIMFV